LILHIGEVDHQDDGQTDHEDKIAAEVAFKHQSQNTHSDSRVDPVAGVYFDFLVRGKDTLNTVVLDQSAIGLGDVALLHFAEQDGAGGTGIHVGNGGDQGGDEQNGGHLTACSFG